MNPDDGTSEAVLLLQELALKKNLARGGAAAWELFCRLVIGEVVVL